MLNKAESIVTSLFMLILIISGIFIFKSYNYIGKYAQEIYGVFVDEKKDKPVDASKDSEETEEEEAKNLQQEMISNMDPDVSDQSGQVLKGLNLKDIYLYSAGTLLENGYIVRMYPETDCEYEFKQMKWLKELSDKEGIGLLYYNKPTKYLVDKDVVDETGIPTYVNENADRFLKGITSMGINHIDFREKISSRNAYQYFYRTDHHETVPTGLMMAEQIAAELNEHYGFDIDMNLLKQKNFESKLYKQSWIGEQGRKVGKAQTGMEDYTEMWPSYKTAFTVKRGETTRQGDFKKALIDESYYRPENNKNVNKAKSWHYAYKGNNSVIINNLNKSGKKVLVLGDSYDAVINAFLSLGISELHSITMRVYKGDLEQYILDNDFDTIIVSYASQMIGAYDQQNDNKRMFAFDPDIE